MRPNDVDLALLVHLFGALVLVGAVVTAAGAAIVGWRREQAGDVATLTRFGLWTIALGAVPSWIVMRVGAQWVYAEENLDELAEDPAWLGIGFITAELGGLLLLIALILGGIGLRQSRSGGGGGLLKASAVIATVLVAVYVIAVWAMGAKPT